MFAQKKVSGHHGSRIGVYIAKQFFLMFGSVVNFKIHYTLALRGEDHSSLDFLTWFLTQMRPNRVCNRRAPDGTRKTWRWHQSLKHAFVKGWNRETKAFISLKKIVDRNNSGKWTSVLWSTGRWPGLMPNTQGITSHTLMLKNNPHAGRDVMGVETWPLSKGRIC